MAGARFFARLPGFLRRPITLGEARATLRHRLEHRADDFLRLAREVIFRSAASPYPELLAWAGCEYGDLEKMVRREGVEGALAVLARRGVYLTVDEYKGRCPIVRGSATLAAKPGALRDPAAKADLSVRTGGSRGAGSPVSIDLAFVRDRAIDSYLAFHAVGGARWSTPSGACPEDRPWSSSWTLPRSGDAWVGGSPRSTPDIPSSTPGTAGARA